MGDFPDLSRTIIDSETGEVLYQGLEGPEIDRLRAEHTAGLVALLREGREKLAARKEEEEATRKREEEGE